MTKEAKVIPIIDDTEIMGKKEENQTPTSTEQATISPTGRRSPSPTETTPWVGNTFKRMLSRKKEPETINKLKEITITQDPNTEIMKEKESTPIIGVSKMMESNNIYQSKKDPMKMNKTLLLSMKKGKRDKMWPWETLEELEDLSFNVASSMTWEYGEFPHYKTLHEDDSDVELLEKAIIWGVNFVVPIGVGENIRISNFRRDKTLGASAFFFDPDSNPNGPLKTLICEDPEIYTTLDDKWICDQYFKECRRFEYGHYFSSFFNPSRVPHNLVLPVTVGLTASEVQNLCKWRENGILESKDIHAKLSEMKPSFNRGGKVFVKIPMGTMAGLGVKSADSAEDLVKVIREMGETMSNLDKIEKEKVVLVVQQGLPIFNSESEIYKPTLILAQALYHEGKLVSVYFMTHPDPSLIILTKELEDRIFRTGLFNNTIGRCFGGEYDYSAPDSAGLELGPLPRHLKGEEKLKAKKCPLSIRNENLINILEYIGKKSKYTGMMDVELIECLQKGKEVDSNTECALLEINPRFSGGIMCTRPIGELAHEKKSILDDYFELLQVDNPRAYVKQLEKDEGLPRIRSMGDEDIPLKADLINTRVSPFLNTVLKYNNTVRTESVIKNPKEEDDFLSRWEEQACRLCL